MEKFAVDLDAVLDELEQFEENSFQGSNSKLTQSQIYTTPPTVLASSSSSSSFRHSPILNAHSASTSRIEARDADFSIQSRPPKILSSLNVTPNNIPADDVLAPSHSSTQADVCQSTVKPEFCPANTLNSSNSTFPTTTTTASSSSSSSSCSFSSSSCCDNTGNVCDTRTASSSGGSSITEEEKLNKLTVQNDVVAAELNSFGDPNISPVVQANEVDDSRAISATSSSAVLPDLCLSEPDFANSPERCVNIVDSTAPALNGIQDISNDSTPINNLIDIGDQKCDSKMSIIDVQTPSIHCDNLVTSTLPIEASIQPSQEQSLALDLLSNQCSSAVSSPSYYDETKRVNVDELTEKELDEFLSDLKDEEEIEKQEREEEAVGQSGIEEEKENVSIELKEDSGVIIPVVNNDKDSSNLEKVIESRLPQIVAGSEELLSADENPRSVQEFNIDSTEEVSKKVETEELQEPSQETSVVDPQLKQLELTLDEEEQIVREERQAEVDREVGQILAELSGNVVEADALDSKRTLVPSPYSEVTNTFQTSTLNSLEVLQDAAASTSADDHQLQDSEPQSEMPTLSQNTAASNSQDRGGLIRNISYFEPQHMPNGLTEHEQMLGKVKPFWVPDDEAQNCLHCDSKFTILKRRHHCRSCGKVLCSQCCNFKARLAYLEGKEARVCQLCYEILMRIEAIERRNGRPLEMISHPGPQESEPQVTFPDPNNPSEYCSTVSPFDQVDKGTTAPTVMVPVGVLKRRGQDSNNGESSSTPKQVIFSDGVRPGGDLIERGGPSSSQMPDDRSKNGRPQLHLKIPNRPSMEGLMLKRKGRPHRVVVYDSRNQMLPPIVNFHELKAIDPNLQAIESYKQLVEYLKADWLPSITFSLSKNLFINAKLVKKTCCKLDWCWSFASKGLASVGQDEIMFVLECNSFKTEPVKTEENGAVEQGPAVIPEVEFPRDVFKMYLRVYDSASKACLFGASSHIFFPDGLFERKENAGFVFVLPTMQCFQNLLLPSPPALIALLIHKWEIPWAKVFPLRLTLRLGHEYNSYPTPVISFADRKSVYYEIGHTIMNVLADFRNFSYTLSTVKDLLIHAEQRKRVNVIIPKASYEQVCKVLSTSNEHVLAFGANFSGKADSHFICTQQEFDPQGQYETAVATLSGITEPNITAANFVVFSGALKSTTGLKAKMNVVEDGLLVQIPSQTMEEMRVAIREMKEFKIQCCKIGEDVADEWVQITWVNDELSTNLGVRSQIDGHNLEGVQSARIFSSPDFTSERYLIRWTEIFILQINENTRRSEMANTSRLAETVAQAFCVSLIEFLDQLFEAGMTKIGLRISLDVDKVGYEAGSNETILPEHFTANLDDALIPAIMDNVSTTGIESAHVIELVFHILYK